MLKRLFPWKLLLGLAAKRYDIIDPISVAARIRSFAQPSEVQEPIELLRAGIIFHARGLINTKAIQHNLDWIWPYWVERQFNPQDHSFIPRAFSFSHINLTHRNWTALGLPDLPLFPIVDPRGLITPLPDGWSIDCWFIDDEGNALCPSKLPTVEQRLQDDRLRRVITTSRNNTAALEVEAAVDDLGFGPQLQVKARVDSVTGGWLVFSLRPCNPEGVQFIEKAQLLENEPGWLVNGETVVSLDQGPDRTLFSNYRQGDVFYLLDRKTALPLKKSQTCRIGMVTAAALHRVEAVEAEREFGYRVNLPAPENIAGSRTSRSWPEAEQGAAELQVPDEHVRFLHDSAIRTLLHLSGGEIVPGPYTYNRFWFRDACLMLNALLAAGFPDRCRQQLATFAKRQAHNGYFHSQDGEWDANGQVLWIMNRYRLLSGSPVPAAWLTPIAKGAEWIVRKRVLDPADPKLRGLLPPGFSAEHFGPNDNYYWDDFWAVAGLHAAADMLEAHNHGHTYTSYRETAKSMLQDILNSLALVEREKGSPAMPTSPNRRLDSGAIGSLVADYPLQLLPPGDRRTMATAGYLFNNCLQKGCFFQDMIHSGINIYMTLALAQTYLRARDPRFEALARAAASFASPTGQWPEAIHPLTGGGCMGDGQHGWAAAEWLMMIRNRFVLEERDRLVIGRGISPDWIARRKRLSYGPTPTPYGPVRVVVDCRAGDPEIVLEAAWRGPGPEHISAEVPGFRDCRLSGPHYRCTMDKSE